MRHWNEATWTKTARRGDVHLSEQTTGMIAGTKVATRLGWRPVEAIAAGDDVLTFDGGLQRVVSVRRLVVWSDGAAMDHDLWPLLVPAGALGNREEMRIMPHQSVLVESDTAEQVFGDPFAMIPAAALDGFRGISRCVPADRIEVITLQFAQDEIVFANIGALFLCPRAVDLMDEIFAAPALSPYSVLSIEKADLLVGFLEIEDQGHVPVRRAAAAFGVAA